MQLLGAGAKADAKGNQEAPEDVQARLPPPQEWKERHGAAGVQADKRRSSPIVELSLLLVCPALVLLGSEVQCDRG